MKLPSFLRQDRLLGGAIVLAITQFGASLVGLIRDRLLAATFPQLGVVDVYVASFRPSDLLFQVTIMSAMGTILIPLLAGHKTKGNDREASRVLTGTMAFGGLVFGSIALIMGIFFTKLAPFFVDFTGPELALYVRFGQMSLLINFLFVFGNALGQYLILEQRYWVYGLTPILYTIGTIFGTLFLTKSFGPLGPMMGTLCGAVLYVLYRAYGALRLGFRPSKKFWHPDLHEMGLKMLPRMIALAALQLQLLFFDKIASGMDAGSVTINAYTRNFQGLIVGIAGIALAQSAYSLLSQVAALGEWHRFRTYVEKGLLLLLLLTVPGSIALIALSSVAARLVHLTHVLHPFTIALILYAISVPFESIAHLFLRSFYALKDTLAPAIWAVFSGVAAVIIAWWLAPKYGVFALPFGYGVGQIIETVILGFLLQKRMKAHASLRSLAEGAISE